MSNWITVSDIVPIRDRAEPYLIESAVILQLRDAASAHSADVRVVQIEDAASAADVVDALKAALPFPDWCGSGWDSVEDAFEDIRQLWRFPLIVVVDGLQPLSSTRQHLALQTVIRLGELSRAFSIAGDQLAVLYSGDSWS
jgi:hypothetical protein